MFTPKNIGELQGALRVLDDCHRAIEELRENLGKPIDPGPSAPDTEWQDYIGANHSYYGAKSGLDSALFKLEAYRRAVAQSWDHRHIHAPAQLAASKIRP